jgi:DNA-binding NarL/FixJ family response regulator
MTLEEFLRMSSVVLLHRDSQVGAHLAQAIGAAPGLVVTGVAKGFPALRELFAQALPDALVVDLMLPPTHVKALLRDLRGNARDGGPRILVLAVSADDPRVMDALRDGADGYYAQADAPLSLAETLEQVLRGESTMTPQIARQVKSHFDALARGAAETAALPEADQRLLQWTSEGFLVAEVARALQISIDSVGVRMHELYRRLQRDLRQPTLTLSAA